MRRQERHRLVGIEQHKGKTTFVFSKNRNTYIGMGIAKLLLIISSGLGIFHGLFLATLLWSTKSKTNISNRILGILVLVLSLRVGKSVLLAFTGKLPILSIYLGLCLMLFVGPLFLLYTKALVQQAQRMLFRDLMHFVAGLVFILLAIPMQHFGFTNIPDVIAGLLFLLIYVHFLGYVLYVKLRIIRHLDSSSQTTAWLNTLFWGLVVIWFEYVMNLLEEQIPYILGPIVYSVTVYYITFLAFKYKYLTAVNAVKYKTTGLKEAEATTLFLAIDRLVQEEQLFLDPNLTLPGLSKRLKVSSQNLSMAINSRSGTNFKEYINTYRVNHATQILSDPGHRAFNISSIAYDSGFNSLSSFNTAFKKVTGTTPSAYKKLTG